MQLTQHVPNNGLARAPYRSENVDQSVDQIAARAHFSGQGAVNPPSLGGYRQSKPALGKAALDQLLEHSIADRLADFFRQGDRGLPLAIEATELWQLDPRPNRGSHVQRANPVDGYLYAIDVDLDRGKREELAGAHRRHR